MEGLLEGCLHGLGSHAPPLITALWSKMECFVFVLSRWPPVADTFPSAFLPFPPYPFSLLSFKNYFRLDRWKKGEARTEYRVDPLPLMRVPL